MKIKELLEGNVLKFPELKQMIDMKTGKKVAVDMSKAVPISMMAAMGDNEGDVLQKAGVKMSEKPSYWEDLVDNTLDELAVKRIEKLLGRKLTRIDGESVYGRKPKGPLTRVNKMPDDNLLILKFEDGTSYLVNTSHANTYIRMWAGIK